MTIPASRSHRAHRDGEHTRETIRDAIRRRRSAHKLPPTVAELVADTGFSETDVRHHIKWMTAQQPPQIRIDPARPMSVVLLDEARP